MDAYQQPHRFMRPPTPPQPPSPADPHHQHHYQYHSQQPPPPPPPPSQPAPPQAPWFSNQFQYHPSQSPPQWAPPHSDHLNPPPNHPYPAHPHPHYNQFPPPPHPHVPPPHLPYHPNHQIPQSYPQVSQEWGNPNWAHHQAWDHPVHKNEEDWAARAKAWAEAKTAMEMQHPQSQFAPAGRPEEQSRYHEHYPQANDSHYPDIQQPSLPASNYQQFPHPAAAPHRPHVDHLQDIASIGSGPSSYFPDGRLHYTVRDGTLAGNQNALYPHQETTSSSVHQQEVPSSYSSATGKEEAADQNEQAYKSLPLPSSSAQEGQQHVQPTLPATGRSVSIEQHFAYGNQSADRTIDLSDQPLDFAPRFNRDHDPHMQSSYAHSDSVGPVRGVDPTAAVPSVHTWTPPVAPGGVYPSVAPVLPSGSQHDPSIGVPSPVHGHAAPPFGRFPGTSFQPSIPTAPFGLGAGAALHPTTAFPGDAYGVSGVPERPKKASVPNWLREEIIKTKSVITSSHEPPEEETQSIEDDGVDKSIRKGDQADSKSIDSSRSTEEEDDDEDYVEAARTAAINHEIKRVLTEVLLKVTDELFDEIATKVLSEDDLTVEVDRKAVAPNHKVSPSSPAVPTPKASAKVLIPVKAKETETESVGGKPSSSTPGDVLGLANYASDDDDDDADDDDEEIQSSGVLNSRKNAVHKQSNTKNLSEDIRDVVQNGSSQVEHEEHIGCHTNMEGGPSRASPSKNNHNAVSSQLSDNRAVRELGHSSVDLTHSSQAVSGDRDDEKYVGGGKMLDDTSASMPKDIVGEKVKLRSELPDENANVKKYAMDDSQVKETRMTSDKNDRHESRRSSVKDFVKEVESGKIRSDENRRRHDERYLRKEKTDDRNGLKERMKEQDVKPGENAKESESRKRSTHSDVKEDRKETERLHRVSADEDPNRKRERTKEKDDDRLRHRLASDSSRHKKRRSSSVSSKGKNGKDNSVSHVHDSSDEASDDSKRKLHSRKRSSSPSPVRSRRRRVSRSPHSKHSQRRHSPYSSLEITRGRRSRSKSPVRRHR